MNRRPCNPGRRSDGDFNHSGSGVRRNFERGWGNASEVASQYCVFIKFLNHRRGSGGRAQPPEANGGLRAEPQPLGDFWLFFSKNNAFWSSFLMKFINKFF